MRVELLNEPARLQEAPGNDDLLIRPALRSDLEDFFDLAALAGPGFTSMPMDEALLADRLIKSERAFAGEPGSLILGLEDQASRRVLGCAAIKPGGQPRPDFLNFLLSHDRRTVSLTKRYQDLTEVGSLLLHPDLRRNGIGRWLAQSRYLLISMDTSRFGHRVFSELRGVVGPDGRSPFYDSVCARHFDLSFADADQHCALGRQGDLNARMPTGPVPIQGLTGEARNAIGRPHRDGEPALRYLLDEGFRFEGVVDLLDGGPAVVANCLDVKTIRCSFAASIIEGEIGPGEGQPAYIATGTGIEFRCRRASLVKRRKTFICNQEVLLSLDLKPGSKARVYIPVD
ncbi:MAG: arginine N-succinyltransferase [Geminicoccaceae bacterium]